jgi:hypothetical protein
MDHMAFGGTLRMRELSLVLAESTKFHDSSVAQQVASHYSRID